MAEQKRRFAVLTGGGDCPGLNAVIAAVVKTFLNNDCEVYGVLNGFNGLVMDKLKKMDYASVSGIIHRGGTILGTTNRDNPFKFAEEVNGELVYSDKREQVTANLKKHGIEALVVIGGDGSMNIGAQLARECGIKVVGCPKTIDGDLKNEQIETSFGFDTACKTYSELIGNIQRDCNSSRKYWHFIKLMGRSASHIALECALQCQPNVCLISEEVEKKNLSLDDIVKMIADSVVARANNGNNYGTVLIPEGLIEFIPTIKKLIAELNDILSTEEARRHSRSREEQIDYVKSQLSNEGLLVFDSLPEDVALQLALDRDPHGNVQVSLIETEKLLSRMVARKLNELRREGKYNGKFSAQHHFFGYEGRCAFPSNFDADYCYSLGYNAFMLIQYGYTGYLSKVSNISKPAEEWVAGGMPITKMMNMERRNGEDKPVIKKALVELDGAPFKFFASKRAEWAKETAFVYPGPIQYFGPAEVADQPTKTLTLEQE